MTPKEDQQPMTTREELVGHTPGPWRENGCVIDGPKMGFQVAQVQYRAAGSNVGFASQTKAQAFANARLIAAAPAMFDYIAKRAAEGDDAAHTLLAEYSITKRS